jgi:hypothetical protein
MKTLKEKLKKCLERNKSGNTVYQKLWNVSKAVLTRKEVTAVSIYIKKKGELRQAGRPQIT